MSAKGPAKGTATIQRLLDERRKYESWIARLRSAADASAAPVRERVEADYAARMKAVDEELKVHAEAARQLIAERQEAVTDLRAREQQIQTAVGYVEALRDYWFARGDVGQLLSGRLPRSSTAAASSVPRQTSINGSDRH